MNRVCNYILFGLFFAIGTLIYQNYTLAKDPENLAFRMPVTSSSGVGQGNYELLTDGNIATEPYLGGPNWVQVDLRIENMIDTIKIWHYWGDGRIYHENKVALSRTGDFLGEEIIVFDTIKKDSEYPETSAGKTISFRPVKARYIRAYINGSNVNQWNHWVELQAFFMNSRQSVKSGDKTPVAWGKIKAL